MENEITIKSIIQNIQDNINLFAQNNERISLETSILSINASIEAARAGDAGKGFAVVASSVKDLAAQATHNSKELRTTVIKDISDQTKILEDQFSQKEFSRLSEMSQTLVQLIVRNLYERTADVRWWATDSALFSCLESCTPEDIDHASFRLGLINRFYSVYLNLVLVDLSGKVIACSRRDKFSQLIGTSFSNESWVKNALATKSGDDYVAEKIYRDPHHQNKLVSVYSTAVRSDGKVNGKSVGALGVFFDWEEQSRVIVQDEPNISQAEWEKTRVLLLDKDLRIIASSDNKNLLETFYLKHNDQQKGNYFTTNHELVCYAKTLGYEEYDGLGWYGVITQTV